MGLSFPRAYCFVRARRLNVIIQPHLRFVYELMKWDEIQQERRGEAIQRDMEWPSVAREIAAMNRPYARSWNSKPYVIFKVMLREGNRTRTTIYVVKTLRKVHCLQESKWASKQWFNDVDESDESDFWIVFYCSVLTKPFRIEKSWVWVYMNEHGRFDVTLIEYITD